jgi:arylsulfatase A-like enzyme
LEWADDIAASEPFFVYLHYMDPHAPYVAHAPWYEEPKSAWLHVKDGAKYDSEINHVDRHIEQALAMLGAGDDTVIVFTADHGEEFMDHGGLQHGFTVYSELVRVPLVVHYPAGALPHRRISALVSLVDVLPTLRALAGAAPSAQDAGIDLTQLCRTGQEPMPRAVFAMRTLLRPQKVAHKHAVVFGRYKLIASEPKGTHELYDVWNDPGEKRDLAGAQPAVVADLLARWRDFTARARGWTPEAFPVDHDAREIDALRELGYTGAGAEGTGSAERGGEADPIEPAGEK